LYTLLKLSNLFDWCGPLMICLLLGLFHVIGLFQFICIQILCVCKYLWHFEWQSPSALPLGCRDTCNLRRSLFVRPPKQHGVIGWFCACVPLDVCGIIYTGHAHSAWKHKALVWCLSVCLSVSPALEKPPVLCYCGWALWWENPASSQHTFRPYSPRLDTLVASVERVLLRISFSVAWAEMFGG